MRASSLVTLQMLVATALAGQQVPFLPIASAPKGAAFLFEDRQGGLWLGAISGAGSPGLTYFDGTNFLSPVVGGFPDSAVSGFAEDSKGGIWVASLSGLLRLEKGHLENIVRASAISGIARVSPDVFLATIKKSVTRPDINAELVRIVRSGESWKTETLMKPISQVRLQVGRSGQILYVCPGGFCELLNTEVVHWHPGMILDVIHHAMLGPPGPPISVFSDRLDCMWLRSSLGASYQCPGDSSATVLPVGVVGQGGGTISELDDGSIVIPSFGQLAIGRPGRFQVISALNGYQGGPYSLVTRDGSIWLSTANGLFVYPSRSRMEFWTERDGLSGNTWSILPLKQKTIAIAGESIRTLDSDRSRWTAFAEIQGATHLSPGPPDTIFISSRAKGVVQMDLQGKIVRESNPVDAMTLAQTLDGQLWMSGSRVSRVTISGGRLKFEPADVPPPQGGGMDLKVDKNDSVWTCYSGGLAHQDGSAWHVLSMTSGLRQNDCAAFAIDQKEAIWYGYTSGGFAMIESLAANRPNIQTFQGGGEVGNATTRFFESDHRGWLWRGTPIGIYVAAIEEARQGRWLFLNRSDGLPGTDANQRSFVEGKDGSVWFGMDNSVIHFFPPDDLVHPRHSPSVFVSGFSLNNGAFQMADWVNNVEHGANIVAHIGSLQFDRRNALRLRYRLLPEQAEWKPERDLDIPLGQLAWGKHTLEVQARIFTGPWSSTVSKSFNVLKPIWLTWPVLLGFAMTGGLAAAGGYRRRTRRKQRAQTALPGLAEWRLAVLAPEVPRLEGSVLDGRFEVGRIIARGGFATVFEGRDLQQGVACAIKIFRHELLENSWMAKRFKQEVCALTQIHHPNVVRIYGHGNTPSGAPYLVMEFIEGKTLRKLLKEIKLNQQLIASYLRQTGSALAEIHARKVCHRDLKPENLMIRSTGDLVLIDFSIAIVQDPDETLHGLSRAAGTLHYMAPEQAIGYADESSDIYSLAKILMEMLTGERLSTLLPDASLDLSTRVRELLTRSDFGLSPASIDLIAAALEFDPARRPKNAEEFAGRISQDLAQ